MSRLLAPLISLIPLATALTSAVTASSAQAQAQAINAEQLTRLVERSKVSVTLFLTDSLNNKALERALTTACYERGVAVRVITTPQARAAPESRLNNLLLACYNSETRRSTATAYEVTLSGSPRGFALIDQSVITGKIGWAEELKSEPSRLTSLNTWSGAVMRQTKPITALKVEQELLRQIRGH